MKICPEGCLDDGLLELVVLGDFGRMELAAKFSHVYAGTHLSLKKIIHARARSIYVAPVEVSADIPIELDGETPGKLPATFEVVPAALRLRF